MKTLKEFVATRNVEQKEPEVVVENQEVEILESEDLPKVLGEAAKPDPVDPPVVLMMHRKAIRQYPNGQRVALYYVDKINKYVTVPYMASMWSTSMPEEWEKTNKD